MMRVPYIESLFRAGSEQALWTWLSLWWWVDRQDLPPAGIELPGLRAYDEHFGVPRDNAKRVRGSGLKELVDACVVNHHWAEEVAGCGLPRPATAPNGKQVVEVRNHRVLDYAECAVLTGPALGRIHPSEHDRRPIVSLYAWLLVRLAGTACPEGAVIDLVSFAGWRDPRPSLDAVERAREHLIERGLVRVSATGGICLVPSPDAPPPTPEWDALLADLPALRPSLEGAARSLIWPAAERERLARLLRRLITDGARAGRIIELIDGMTPAWRRWGATPARRMRELCQQIERNAARPDSPLIVAEGAYPLRAASPTHALLDLSLTPAELLAIHGRRLRLVFAQTKGQAVTPVAVSLHGLGLDQPIIAPEWWQRGRLLDLGDAPVRELLQRLVSERPGVCVVPLSFSASGRGAIEVRLELL